MSSFSAPPISSRKLPGRGRPLGAVLGKIITPVCRKQGLMTADLILDWPKIVGPELAAICQVIKISFTGSFSPPSRQQGCLHVQTTSTIAAVLPYSEPIILERVNQYYGYQAINRIRVFHQPPNIKAPPKVTPMPPAPLVISPVWCELIQQVEDPNLKQALEDLAKSLQRPTHSSRFSKC